MTPAPQAYRVKRVNAIVAVGVPTFTITVEAVDYGPDEDGPQVGQILNLESQED